MVTQNKLNIAKFSSPGDPDYQFIVGKVKQILSKQELNTHDVTNPSNSSMGRPFANLAELPDSQVDYIDLDDAELSS